jgi:hypothetical protein
MVEVKIGKFTPNVPTTKIMQSTTMMSGRVRTYRKPATICPFPRPARTRSASCAGSTKRSATRTARNDPALMTNTQPEPIAAMSTPATAGPIRRAALNDAEFRATAFETSSPCTTSETKACRIGASNAATMPRASAKPYSASRVAVCVRTMTPRPSPSSPIRPWVSMSIFRRSNRSAASPVSGRSSSWGPNCRAIVMPTATALLSESWVSTIQSWAVRCIHVPTFDTRAPANQMR